MSQHLGVAHTRSAAHTCRHTCCSATEGHGSPALCKTQLLGTHVLHHWMHCTLVHARYPLQQHKPLAGGCCRVCVPQPCWFTPANIRQSRRAGCQHGGLGLSTHITSRVGCAQLPSIQLKSACAAPTCTGGCAGTGAGRVGHPKQMTKQTLSTAGEDLYPANVAHQHEDPSPHKSMHTRTRASITTPQTVQPLTLGTARMHVSAKVRSTVRKQATTQGLCCWVGSKAKRAPPRHECGCIYSDVTGGHLQRLLVLCGHISVLGGMFTASWRRQQQQAG